MVATTLNSNLSGDDIEWWTIGIAVVTFLFGILTAAITATWILGRSTGNAITQKDLTTFDTLVRELIKDAGRDFGETVTAIRKKVEEVEIWVRDHRADKNDVDDNSRSIREITKRLEQLSAITVKVDTMWDFMMDRAKVEATLRGLMKHESPLTLTPEGRRIIEPLLPEVTEFCHNHPNLNQMTEDELEIELAHTFRQRLLEEVCEPNGIYMGACIVMLMEALRLEKVIPVTPSKAH